MPDGVEGVGSRHGEQCGVWVVCRCPLNWYIWAMERAAPNKVNSDYSVPFDLMMLSLVPSHLCLVNLHSRGIISVSSAPSHPELVGVSSPRPIVIIGVVMSSRGNVPNDLPDCSWI